MNRAYIAALGLGGAPPRPQGTDRGRASGAANEAPQNRT
jgi:hypothetical protein